MFHVMAAYNCYLSYFGYTRGKGISALLEFRR